MERLHLKRYESLTEIKGYEEIAELEQLQMKGGVIPIAPTVDILLKIIGGAASIYALYEAVKKSANNDKDENKNGKIDVLSLPDLNKDLTPEQCDSLRNAPIQIDSIKLKDGTMIYCHGTIPTPDYIH